MLCRNPFTQGMQAFPCGQCMPCRFNRRRLWQGRIMLESLCYSDNAFVTLTYAEDKLPVGMSLVPKDLQDWLKRFRKAIDPLKIRFFAVGEYGDVTQRPHYHAALFGYPYCACYVSNRGRPHEQWVSCAVCSLVRETWGKGLVHIGRLEKDSAGYIAGYVTKKMTAKDDERLNGRAPEFSRMSLRPGIGANYMWEAASVSMQFKLDVSQPDVPSYLMCGGKPFPLGRYLRQKYRLMIGKDKHAPQETMDEMASKVFEVYAGSILDKENPSFKAALIADGAQAVLNAETRRAIHKKGKRI